MPFTHAPATELHVDFDAVPCTSLGNPHEEPLQAAAELLDTLHLPPTPVLIKTG